MLMGFYTEEQIKKARSIDLMTYLRTCDPTELIHVSGCGGAEALVGILHWII